MVLAIPVDIKGNNATLTKINSANAFALLDIHEGSMGYNISYADDFEKIEEKFDILIVCDKNEPVKHVQDFGVKILLAKEGMSIEDLYEAYAFATLDEIKYD